MGYMHIINLYKDQTVLIFRECFALEKIHGTSAHVRWKDGQIHFHSGGEKQARFESLFDASKLRECFEAMGHDSVTVFGEAYGGKQQRQAWRYGADLRFVAFDVRVGETWLGVTDAKQLVVDLGLEFVHYAKISTEMVDVHAERDAPSEQARRNGVEGDKPREGVVLRPLLEFTLNNGARVMAKHKRDEERETASPRKVVDPENLKVLENANAIALEWVTPRRLEHVLDKHAYIGPEYTRDVISAMTEDVLREGAGEFVDSREVRRAIGRATVELFHERLKAAL